MLVVGAYWRVDCSGGSSRRGPRVVTRVTRRGKGRGGFGGGERAVKRAAGRVGLRRLSRHIRVVGLNHEDIEAVARRVVELLNAQHQDDASQPALIDAAAVARLLGVSRATVYAKADELGAIRLGNGKRARLRFDPRLLVAAHGPSDSGPVSARRGRSAVAERPGRRSTAPLPIRPAGRRAPRRPSGYRGRS
jgi:hypothetical protein